MSERKRVGIFSEDAAFARALRLKLGGYETALFADAAELPGQCDAWILHFRNQLRSRLLETASALGPTLTLADRSHLLDAVDAGCRGFLPLSASLDDIEEALETVLRGGAVVPPDLLGRLLGHLVERHRHNTEAAIGLQDLTDRERQVFHLAAEGARKEEIGERLFISPSTARTHLQRIYRKLGVHSQSELMALANQAEQSEPEEPQ